MDIPGNGARVLWECSLALAKLGAAQEIGLVVFHGIYAKDTD